MASDPEPSPAAAPLQELRPALCLGTWQFSLLPCALRPGPCLHDVLSPTVAFGAT